MQCGVLERTIHRVLVLNAHERALTPPSMVVLARSKRGLLGEGIIKATPFCNGPCYLATALRVWLDAAGIASGAEFRSISNRRDGRHRAWRGQREHGSERLRHVGRPGLRVRPASYGPRRGMTTSAQSCGISRSKRLAPRGQGRGYTDGTKRFQANAARSLQRSRPKVLETMKRSLGIMLLSEKFASIVQQSSTSHH